jgi:hypothetical protein
VVLLEDESAAVRWVEYLLKNHPDSLIVEVAHQASADSHQMQYNKPLEKELSDMFGYRGSDRIRKPSGKRNLVMIKSRLHDIYIGMFPPEEKSKHPSLTRKRGKK